MWRRMFVSSIAERTLIFSTPSKSVALHTRPLYLITFDAFNLRDSHPWAHRTTRCMRGGGECLSAPVPIPWTTFNAKQSTKPLGWRVCCSEYRAAVCIVRRFLSQVHLGASLARCLLCKTPRYTAGCVKSYGTSWLDAASDEPLSRSWRSLRASACYYEYLLICMPVRVTCGISLVFRTQCGVQIA